MISARRKAGFRGSEGAATTTSTELPRNYLRRGEVGDTNVEQSEAGAGTKPRVDYPAI